MHVINYGQGKTFIHTSIVGNLFIQTLKTCIYGKLIICVEGVSCNWYCQASHQPYFMIYYLQMFVWLWS